MFRMVCVGWVVIATCLFFLTAQPTASSQPRVAQVRVASVPPPIQGNAVPVIQGTPTWAYPLTSQGALGENVRKAILWGNMQHIVIRPGETWSYNQAVGVVTADRLAALAVFAGVPGGGWCDHASRYVQVMRLMGFGDDAIRYEWHGVCLAGVDCKDSVNIWNVDGTRGSHGARGDLELTNTGSRTIHFVIEEREAAFMIGGYLE